MRFPEFSGEWEKYKLGDIMEFTKVRISSSLLTAVNYVSTENMLQDFQGVTCAHNVPEDTNVMEYKQGDVLVSNIRPYLKKVWKADKDGGCSADVFVMRANRNVCTDDFLHHIVANDRFIGYVMNGAKGVKMPRGDKEQMKGFKTALPSLKEQQKVAHLLAIINERIITQIRIIDKLQSLMKGLAEHLTAFTPNTKIADCLNCHSSILQENQVKNEGKYKVYGANGICGYNDSPAILEDAILIVKDGSGVGNVSYASGEYSVIGTSNYLTAKSGYSLKYLYFCLMIFNFVPYRTGMAIPHIYFKDYGKALIPCPSLNRQKQIATLLSKIECKIETEKTITESYLQQKRFLLKSMFI